MPVNGRLTGVNETAVCMVCGACATNLREWSMRLGRVIHVVVIAARRSSAVASGRYIVPDLFPIFTPFGSSLHSFSECDQDWCGQGWSLQNWVAPPPKVKSPDMPPARCGPSPLANIPNGLPFPMSRDVT